MENVIFGMSHVYWSTSLVNVLMPFSFTDMRATYKDLVQLMNRNALLDQFDLRRRVRTKQYSYR